MNRGFSGTENPAAVTVNQDMNINVLFEELTHPLTVEVEGNGQIQEEIVNARSGLLDRLLSLNEENLLFTFHVTAKDSLSLNVI